MAEVPVSRQDIRIGVAEYFGGTTQDERGFYRATPLAEFGLSGVWPYFVNYDNRVEDRDYFEGLDSGATFGAVMAVHLNVSTETRLEIGGVLNAPFNTQLYLWYFASKQSPGVAQAAFDDLLDAIKARIRADPTLGMGINSGAPAIVTQAGEGETGITVNTPPPYTEPGAYTFGSSVISFNVSTYPAG
jgi:hypothetical protein